jgi:hypothetical protein
MIYVQFGLGIQKVMGSNVHREHGDLTSLLGRSMLKTTVTRTPIARQRVGKQVLAKTFSVNSPLLGYLTILTEKVLSMWSSPCPGLTNRTVMTTDRCFLWCPCRRFIGDSEGRLQSVIADKPWVKDTKPSRGVQEGSAPESTRTKMQHVLSELLR